MNSLKLFDFLNWSQQILWGGLGEMRLWSQIRADRVFKSGKRQMSSGGQLNNDPCKSRCSLCWQVDVLCVMSSWKFMYRFLPVEALRSKIYLIDQQHQILPVDTNTQELQLNKVTMQQTNARSNGVIIAWKLWLTQMQRKDKKKKNRIPEKIKWAMGQTIFGEGICIKSEHPR